MFANCLLLWSTAEALEFRLKWYSLRKEVIIFFLNKKLLKMYFSGNSWIWKLQYLVILVLSLVPISYIFCVVSWVSYLLILTEFDDYFGDMARQLFSLWVWCNYVLDEILMLQSNHVQSYSLIYVYVHPWKCVIRFLIWNLKNYAILHRLESFFLAAPRQLLIANK